MKRLFLLLAMITLIAFDSSAGKVKTKYRNALVFVYSQANSVYEDDNIKLEIYNETLYATNKTSRTIFIDLDQCFLYHNGASSPFISTGERDSKSNKSEKNASKRGLSSSEDHYITLAPSMGLDQSETGIWRLTSSFFYGSYSTTETPSGDFSEYTKRLFKTIEGILSESPSSDPTKGEYVGTVVRHFTEDESINIIGASIGYAFNKKAEDWTNISLSTWVSDVIFTPYFIELPEEIKKKDMKGFGIKETAPAYIHVRADSPFEFDEDKCPMIVCDWEGNYKKGTFNLMPTWIIKKKGLTALQIMAAPFTYGLSLLGSKEDTEYKRAILFDGADSDWGKVTYVDDIMQTEQTD